MTETAPDSPYKLVMTVHGRPIYTYMTLDALHQNTRTPYHLTVVHHRPAASENDAILSAFQRRGVIHRIVELTDPVFDWTACINAIKASLAPSDKYLFYIEDDVVIEPGDQCWLAAMAQAFDEDPKLASVGSAIDKRDFIDPVALAAELGRDLTNEELNVIKAASPERNQEIDPGQKFFKGHTVAGRLMGIRLEAITQDTPLMDARFDRALRDRGWTTGTLTSVRHRHLSLLNYYDYPEYYTHRETHFSQTRGNMIPSVDRSDGPDGSDG